MQSSIRRCSVTAAWGSAVIRPFNAKDGELVSLRRRYRTTRCAYRYDKEKIDLLNLRRVAITAGALVALGATWLGGAMTAGGATKAPAAVRAMLAGTKNPIGAKGRALGLSKVTIPTGVVLPLHHHEGTQVAYVQQGVLLYSVRSGSVRVMQGLADQSPRLVRTIGPGQTGAINAGQWIVEQPTVVHSAKAKARVIVLLATLLRNGAPPATPVK